MKRKILSLALAMIMALGIVTPAVAAGPTFSDVPESHWAYADVEAAAAQGLMNGTGNGMFSPDLKVSVSQFLTLVGRVVFPDTKVTENDSWYGPYVAAAQTNGLLEGTQVDVNNVEAEITRYDMAVILRAAAKKLGVAEKAAQSSQVTDYGMIPTMYADAVLAVYGMGLIKGDGNGNFNGNNTMMRSEVVTVVVRLAKAKSGGSSQGGGNATDPAAPTQPDVPTDPAPQESPYAWASANAPLPTYDPDSVTVTQGRELRFDLSFLSSDVPTTSYVYLHVGDTLQLKICEVPSGYGYDGSEATWTSDNESVATVDENGRVTALKCGCAQIKASVPVRYAGTIWTTSSDVQVIYVDP